jgi:hypothetical protein
MTQRFLGRTGLALAICGIERGVPIGLRLHGTSRDFTNWQIVPHRALCNVNSRHERKQYINAEKIGTHCRVSDKL